VKSCTVSFNLDFEFSVFPWFSRIIYSKTCKKSYVLEGYVVDDYISLMIDKPVLGGEANGAVSKISFKQAQSDSVSDFQ
jgi:hypothetical protein